MSDEFTTVLSCWSVEDAHLARIRLAAEGIEGHLVDDLMVGTYWSLANAMRGVKLVVRQDEADAARKILDLVPDIVPFTDRHVPESHQDASPHRLDDHLTTTDEEVDEHEAGMLTTCRSFKRPVIWMILAPTLLSPLILISSMIAYLLRELGIFGGV